MIKTAFIALGFALCLGAAHAQGTPPPESAAEPERVPASEIDADLTAAVGAPLEEIETFEWPVASLIDGRETAVVSGFGQRAVPGGKEGDTELHEGVDFAVPAGTVVKASRAGRVLFAGASKSYTRRADKKQPNLLVIIRHGDHTSTRYVNLGSIKVRPPKDVAQGETIGSVDSTDEQETPVLHFEIRDAMGGALDPADLLEGIAR